MELSVYPDLDPYFSLRTLTSTTVLYRHSLVRAFAVVAYMHVTVIFTERLTQRRTGMC